MSSSLKILFHLPTRSRPEKAMWAIQNIIDNVVDDNYLILISCDLDDTRMGGFSFPHSKVLVHCGKSNNKVHACNRSIHLIKDWDILVASSDDMQFKVKGFDNIIRDSAGDGLLHFNDGNQGANVCTLSIMGREYYESFGYVYHPDYENLWCDVEATDVAKIRRCYKYIDTVIFQHLHPAWGLAPMDEQYQRQDNIQTSAKDKATYERRKANGFC